MLDERALDDVEALAAGDPSGVLRALAGAGAQVRRAAELASETSLARLDPSDRPRSVVVAARGGAGVVADAVAALAGAGSQVLVVARTGDVLPGWVGPMDLVVAVSLSGGAGPAVQLVAEAGRRGARVLTVGADDSSLSRVSAQVRGTHVPTPSARDAVTAPTTRTALWSLLTPVLLAGDRLGLWQAGDDDLAGLADALDAEAAAARPSSETFVNPAKALAVELDGAIPVVLGDGPVSAVAARRAATVLARTARVPALAGTLPDDAGDVVATFGGPFAARSDEDLFADPFLDGPTGPRLRLLLLREAGAQASAAVLALAERSGVRVSEVVAEDASPLQRLGLLVARTDFAATYLAIGCGTDPAVSPHVADLRDALS